MIHRRLKILEFIFLSDEHYPKRTSSLHDPFKRSFKIKKCATIDVDEEMDKENCSWQEKKDMELFFHSF